MRDMDPQDVEVLQSFRQIICSDVMFETIAPALVQTSLLNRDELQQVQAKDSDAQRMELVLDMLPTKGSDALSKFTSVLLKNYRWIAENIRRSRPSTTNDCNTASDNKRLREQQLNQKVSTDMISMVSKNYRVAQKWTNLAHSLKLDSQIASIRMRVLVFQEDFNLCIKYLLQEWIGQCPKTANLGNLLTALRQDTFNDIADELEQQFANL
ncbi:hypothetical protein B566_EDAN008691 [Ephemera danica]|nr:hypothetical protein B566_EDAN008691 [Ephemera danica]